MLTKFQSMCDGHLDGIMVANRRTKFLDECTEPVHSSTYRAGPKNGEFEEIKIEKMLF